jgi:hypothetical protein
VLHPDSQIFLTNLIDEAHAGELNIVPRLKDVNAIIHIYMTLPFDGDGGPEGRHIYLPQQQCASRS